MNKILFITYTNSNGGGAESLLTSYANNIDPTKYEITILEIEHFDIKKEPLNSNISFKKVPVYYNNTKKHFVLYYFSKINQNVLVKRPELIRSLFNLKHFDYVISWNYQLPSFLLPAFPDSYRIGFFHSSIEDLLLNETNKKKYLDLEDKIKNQYNVWNDADKIITISNKSFKSLLDVFPIFREKSEIINNGINTSEVITNSRVRVNESFKIDTKYKYMCCCGRIDERKNFQLAVKALHLVSKQISNVKLVIIGMGDKYQELKKLVEDLQLNDKVIFTGYQQNPHPIIAQCDVFCMTSLSEGFPMVIMEAMALGKPFVTTPVSGASEELSDNNLCGLVAEWDENDYAGKVLKLLSDDELYNKMKQNCLEGIKKFSIEASIQKFYTIFENAEKKKLSYKKKCTFLNKFKYFMYAAFYFNIDWFSKKIKNNPFKAALYVLAYICSIILFPFKFMYILIYMIIVGL